MKYNRIEYTVTSGNKKHVVNCEDVRLIS